MTENICNLCKQPRSKHVGIGEACPPPVVSTGQTCKKCGKDRAEHTGIGEHCPA